MNLDLLNHPVSKRIKLIKIKEQELDKLIFPFNKHTIQSLEYKPFSRFALAKSVDEVFSGELSRTLNTSFTTLVVLISMFMLGADSLRGLLFALIVGVIVGTYSSVFVATPIMHDTTRKN